MRLNKTYSFQCDPDIYSRLFLCDVVKQNIFFFFNDYNILIPLQVFMADSIILFLWDLYWLLSSLGHPVSFPDQSE